MTRIGTWFANLRIGAKSALAPAFGIIGLIVIAAGAVLVLARLTEDFRSLNDTSFVRFAEAAKLDRAALRVNAELYAIGSLAANADDTKLLTARIAAVQQHMGDLTRDAAAVTGLAGGAGDGKAIVAALAAYRKSATEMLDMAGADSGMALLLMGGVQDNFVRLEGLLDAQVDAVDRGRAETYQSALGSIGGARAALVAAALLATLLAMLAAVTATRAISRPVVALTAVMTRMAEGSERGRDCRLRTPQRTRCDGARAPCLQRERARARPPGARAGDGARGAALPCPGARDGGEGVRGRRRDDPRDLHQRRH